MRNDALSLGLTLSSLSDEEVLVNVRNDTSSSNGSLDEKVELFVTSNGELKMSGGDSSDFEVFGGVSSQLQNLSSQVLENGSCVDGSS